MSCINGMAALTAWAHQARQDSAPILLVSHDSLVDHHFLALLLVSRAARLTAAHGAGGVCPATSAFACSARVLPAGSNTVLLSVVAALIARFVKL